MRSRRKRRGPPASRACAPGDRTVLLRRAAARRTAANSRPRSTATRSSRREGLEKGSGARRSRWCCRRPRGTPRCTARRARAIGAHGYTLAQSPQRTSFSTTYRTTSRPTRPSLDLIQLNIWFAALAARSVAGKSGTRLRRESLRRPRTDSLQTVVLGPATGPRRLQQHVGQFATQVLLTPDQLFLARHDDAFRVSTLGTPRTILGQVEALVRTVAELDVGDLVTQRDREILSR